MNSYELLKTISYPATERYTDRGSKFYAYAYPVMEIKHIEKAITEVTKKSPGATHYCYAWRFDPFSIKEFSQDDGEPSGTAGSPILGVLKSASLINVLVVVARFFGGTKLGKSGLIQAYRESANRVITNTRTINLQRYVPVTITYPYQCESHIQELIYKFDLQKGKEIYTDYVTMTLYCEHSYAAEFLPILDHLAHLGIKYESSDECFRPVDKKNI